MQNWLFQPGRGQGSLGPIGVTARPKNGQRTVGKQAPVVPEGGARSLRTAPRVCFVVTQHEPAASPRLHTGPGPRRAWRPQDTEDMQPFNILCCPHSGPAEKTRAWISVVVAWGTGGDSSVHQPPTLPQLDQAVASGRCTTLCLYACPRKSPHSELYPESS